MTEADTLPGSGGPDGTESLFSIRVPSIDFISYDGSPKELYTYTGHCFTHHYTQLSLPGIMPHYSRLTSSFAFILIITLLFLSCEGPVGPAGERGLPGEEGVPGLAGKDGSAILSGSGSPGMTIGNAGDFYFNTESKTLYGPKTEEGWGHSVSLKGDPGVDGKDGSSGADGSQIYSGDMRPHDALGTIGDYYLNTDTSELFGPKTEEGWGNPLLLKGPQGETGPQGPQGPQGDPGPPGATGNANVIVATASLSGSSWTYDNRVRPGNASTPMRSRDLKISDITSSFGNLASIVVYVKLSNHADAGYEPLPYRFFASDNDDYSVNITFQYDEEKVRLFYYLESNDPDVSHPSGSSVTVPDMNVRIILTDSSAEPVVLNSIEWSDLEDLENYLEQTHRVERRLIGPIR